MARELGRASIAQPTHAKRARHGQQTASAYLITDRRLGWRRSEGARACRGSDLLSVASALLNGSRPARWSCEVSSYGQGAVTYRSKQRERTRHDTESRTSGRTVNCQRRTCAHAHGGPSSSMKRADGRAESNAGAGASRLALGTHHRGRGPRWKRAEVLLGQLAVWTLKANADGAGGRVATTGTRAAR